MVDDLCDENLVEMDLASDDDDDLAQQGQPGQSAAAAAAAPAPPPYAAVANHFGELEDAAEKCRMSEVSLHLRNAKLAWMSAYGSRETQQTCMRDSL